VKTTWFYEESFTDAGSVPPEAIIGQKLGMRLAAEMLMSSMLAEIIEETDDPEEREALQELRCSLGRSGTVPTVET